MIYLQKIILFISLEWFADDIEKAAEIAKKGAVTVHKITDDIDGVVVLVEDGADKLEEYVENVRKI